MGDIVESVAKFVEPINKLIDCVSSAIGKAYEPRHIRKMADAKAYEIKALGEAMRENCDIPIEYSPSGTALSTSDFQQFVERTEKRLAYQELKKQANIEAVADKAYEMLEGKEKVTAEPVDEDWMLRFFNTVEDIGNEDMQTLWAKLLAGEVRKPGSFSLRTLEKLRNMTQHEAELFEELCKHCVCGDNEWYIICDENYTPIVNVRFDTILKMGECGLINSGTFLAFSVIFEEKQDVLFTTNDYALAADVLDDNAKLSLPAFPFTESGNELARIVGCHMAIDEFKQLAIACKTNHRLLNVYVHPITQIFSNEIDYDEKINLLDD